MKKGVLILGLLLLLASLFGCEREGGIPRELRGTWLDLNGDTTLEIGADSLKLSWGEWSESYSVKLEDQGWRKVIVNAKEEGYGFGLVSDLTVEEDGSLTGYEQILDAEGHTYRFLRAADLAALQEIKDLSTDAPKTIESTEITDFELYFYNAYGSYGLGDEWPSGRCDWQIEREADGSYTMTLSVSGPSYIALNFRERVTEDYVRGLAERMNELGIPAHNGYHKRNEVDRHDWSLYVKYASGEKLTLSAEGDAAAACPFDLKGLMDYAALQPLWGEE